MFAEGHATWWLVGHAILGAAAVASATHLALWLRGYLRGTRPRPRAVRWFAVSTLVLYAATFVAGNVVYPTYRTRVRAEYLDNSAAIASDLREQAAARAQLAPGTDPPDADGRVAGAARIARWFDVKEHWAAFGLILAAALTAILLTWDPKRHGRAIQPIVTTMSVAVAASGWFAAIVGLVTTAARPV